MNQFYALIRAGWGSGKFSSQFADQNDLMRSKRYWAPRILVHSDEDLARAVSMATDRKLAGDARYDWPDIGVILSTLSIDGVGHQQRRQSAEPPLALPYRPDKEFGRHMLAEIKGMLA